MVDNQQVNYSVLFVCMGNICRSPMAQGVLEQRLREAGLEGAVRVDSAGTHGYHQGEAPDARARAAAGARGLDISAQRARTVEAADFERFDLILAMDDDNAERLRRIAPDARTGKISLFMDYAPAPNLREVPDPYYGAAGGFEQVFDLVEAAAEGLLADIRRRHL